MKRSLILTIAVAAALLCSCAKKNAASDQPHATVLLRDGTSVSGSVLASSASEIKILGDDQITRTIPMSQVQQVNYGQPQSAQANPPQPEPTAPPQQQAPPAAPPEPAARRQAAIPPAAPPARREASGRTAAPPPSASAVAPAQEPVTTRTFVAPAGTQISVRTDETLDSATAGEGQLFPGSITASVQDANGDVVIPRGARAQLVIRSASQGGKIRGASDLVLDVQSIDINGRSYQLSTADLAQEGRQGVGANKRTGLFTGGVAALGAVIGAIAGGGKGAAIGAGSGAVAGAATQVLTKGKIKIPAETILTFQLDKPLRVQAQ